MNPTLRTRFWITQAIQAALAASNIALAVRLGRLGFNFSEAQSELLLPYFDWASRIVYHSSRNPLPLAVVSLLLQWLQLRTFRTTSTLASVSYWIVVNALLHSWHTSAVLTAIISLHNPH